ncbi:MAG TPA: adenylate/guanylate cyclase domain-containing protein [Leptospiraceae bacterium]|nr:adenylate/guanylate cyclase domain-containing protein [Leptospiraceae bacterium]HMW07068.1 adenylate/guanylate cyclase domain-containing protein [Leptospiraceae bacterium]HMX34475.1 adenylate/guanylate cyclase domain-containing protein [Leptospiraceae bacterium]HMY33741.1 adenylate/guanylate cyclase domain-containing protein [Leptospiraceae bacterium]HMZ66233.1 adenylate/guanylate cyclase domain-containing protein [Leptospiraceae bacterium]
MFKVGIGQSDEIDTLCATEKAIAQARNSLGSFIPQACILFAGLDFEHEKILEEINKTFPDINLIGCSSGGEITSEFGFTDDSIVILLLYSDEVSFSIGLGYDSEMNSEIAANNALEMARKNLTNEEKLCLVFTDSFSLSGNKIIQTLNQKVTKGCKIFGGVSARPFVSNLKTKQFFKDKALSQSVVVMLIGGPIEYKYSLSHTWKPIGRKAIATLVEGKKLIKIDDMRALDYYHYYLGDFSFPAPEFPLAVYQNDSEDFYIRVPGGYNKEDGSVLFAGEIPQGSTIQLTEAMRDYIVDDLDQESIRQKKMKINFEPAMAFAFSCIVRKQILGTKVKEEIRVLKEHFPPSFPIFGFYTYGEISPLESEESSNLHNCTMVTLVIGTKSTSNQTEKKEANQDYPEESPNLSDSEIIEEQKNEILKLRKKLEREHSYRVNLENVKDFHGSVLKTINHEIEAAKQVIQQKNVELEKLYKALESEKKKSDDLLLNILPTQVAEELKQNDFTKPVYYESASVLFTDFKGFTKIAGKMSPSELVTELDFYFSEFDRVIEKYGLEKLKTIGDAYMCASGLPKINSNHAIDLVNAALEIQEFMLNLKKEKGESVWELRIGINSGPLMAGVIGKKKFSYDVWGDTVNIASRLESNGEAGKINISQYTYELIRDHFICEYRGKIAAKNKGEIDMYFVLGRK